MSTIIMNNNNTSNKMRVKLDEDRFEEVQISYIKSEGRQQEGKETNAIGSNSHTEGEGTIAAGKNQHVQGCYNIEDTIGDYAHIVGNGTSDTNRSNAHTLDWEGNAWFAGDVTGQINENGNITTHILSNKANQSDLNILNNNFNNLTYAASNSVGGPANKVANALSINLQNKEQGGDGSVTSSAVAWTYDGSEARSLNLSIVHYNPVVANANAAAGLMTAADKIKLDGITAGANKYSLPAATASTLGGVKIGSNISINSGTISLSKTNITNALEFTPVQQADSHTIKIGWNDKNPTIDIDNGQAKQVLATHRWASEDNAVVYNKGAVNYRDVQGKISCTAHLSRTASSEGLPKDSTTEAYSLLQMVGPGTRKYTAQILVDCYGGIDGGQQGGVFVRSSAGNTWSNWIEITNRIYQDTGEGAGVYATLKSDGFKPGNTSWNNKWNLGAADARWKTLYLSEGINIGGQTITAEWIAKVNAALKS